MLTNAEGRLLTEPAEKIAGCKLWYWSTPALDDEVRARVEAESERRAPDAAPPSSSLLVRRAVAGYLAHVCAGGRPEPEAPRVAGDPRTSATLKCYAHVPLSLRAALASYLRALGPRDGPTPQHASRKSSTIRAAVRWWLRRNP